MKGRRPAFDNLLAHLKRVGYLHVHLTHHGVDAPSSKRHTWRVFHIVTHHSTPLCERDPSRCAIIKLHDVGEPDPPVVKVAPIPAINDKRWGGQPRPLNRHKWQ